MTTIESLLLDIIYGYRIFDKLSSGDTIICNNKYIPSESTLLDFKFSPKYLLLVSPVIWETNDRLV